MHSSLCSAPEHSIRSHPMVVAAQGGWWSKIKLRPWKVTFSAPTSGMGQKCHSKQECSSFTPCFYPRAQQASVRIASSHFLPPGGSGHALPSLDTKFPGRKAYEREGSSSLCAEWLNE